VAIPPTTTSEPARSKVEFVVSPSRLPFARAVKPVPEAVAVLSDWYVYWK